MINQNKKYWPGIKTTYERDELPENKNNQTPLFINLLFAFIIVSIASLGMRFVEDGIIHKSSNLPHKLNPFHLTVASAAEINNEATYIAQSHSSVRIVPNKGFTFTVKFKNTGNKTWYKNHVYLKSLTTGLKFRHEYWPDPFLPGAIKEGSVPPGGEATFVFAVQAPPSFGEFEGEFVLADDNVMIKNGRVKIKMDVCADPNKPVETPKAPAAPTVLQPPTTQNNTQKPVTQNVPAYCPYTLSAAASKSSSPECLPATESKGPLIRVGLMNNPDPYEIKNEKAWQLFDGSDNLLATIAPGQVVSLDYDETTGYYIYKIGAKRNTTKNYLKLKDTNEGLFIVTNYTDSPSWNPKINYNDFTGDLEVRYNSSKDRTWLIETIAMEDYLKGISETSNGSPLEYLKTMTIAARTYAYYHYNKGTKHADEYFDVDSKYDQVYKGYTATIIWKDLKIAVEQTNGIIATYEGRPIVAAYFSRSDGRTRSFKEVWGNDVPYLVSVPCPYSQGKELWGHGVGIDASDAYHRADKGGAAYDEILKHYYTGISLEKMW
ncbi:MAG: SpoIID/LytB domain-containing protein [Patescibacteria group bacterium]